MLEAKHTNFKLKRKALTLIDSTSKNADDVVITLAIRTPFTRAGRGALKDTRLEYMVYALLKEVRERSNLDPALVEDITLGNVAISRSRISQHIKDRLARLT